MYSDAFETHYVPSADRNKRSFAVIPRLADLEDNALSTTPAGLYVKNLSPQVNTLETEMNDITTTVDFMNASQNIYVNSTTGNDSNSGVVNTQPFATLDKAIELAKKCKKSIIYISAGEYVISGNLMLTNMYCRFQGNTSEDTIIKTSAEIIADNSYLHFSNLTIDSSGSVVNTIRGQHAGNVTIFNCIMTTSYNFCMCGTGESSLYSFNTTFNGAIRNVLYIDHASTLYVTNIVDNSNKGIYTDSGTVYIVSNKNPIPKYSTAKGTVYLNGQQVLPVLSVESKVQKIEDSLVGKKDSINSKGEIFCDYENNKATGNYSATFGSSNTVSDASSFSIGHQNAVNGNASFSTGICNTVNGSKSMTLGQYLLTSSDNQIVVGKNNVEDTNNNYALIIGNGDNPGSGRHNAFAIDWSGNIYVNGSTSGVNIQELASAVSDSTAVSIIYVNAETGNDLSNSGLSVDKPFKTLEKALSYSQYKNKAVFYLAAGEYEMPGNSKLFSNVYRRFHGNSSDDTIIKTGEIQSDRSYLYFENLTLSSSTGVNSVLKAQHHGSVYVKNCVVDTPHTYCIYATAFSDICVANTTFNRAKTYAVSAIDGSNMRVNNCIDNTGKGIRVGATSVAYIKNTSENTLKYAISDYGMVYLNGQQVAPTPTSETAILSMGGNI